MTSFEDENGLPFIGPGIFEIIKMDVRTCENGGKMKVIVLSEDQTKRIVEDMNQKFQDDGKKKKAVHLKHNLIVIEGEDDFMFFDVYENEGAIVLSEFQCVTAG